jgi:hypothetical protein
MEANVEKAGGLKSKPRLGYRNGYSDGHAPGPEGLESPSEAKLYYVVQVLVDLCGVALTSVGNFATSMGALLNIAQWLCR